MISKEEQAAEIRRQAEEKFQALEPSAITAIPKDEVEKLFYELQVHQIELEIQNENMQEVFVQLNAARARFFDLYDLAPIGYLTLSEKGLILEANLTVATMLNIPRSALVKRPLTQFIFKEDQDIYYQRRRVLFDTGSPQQCEIRMMKSVRELLWMQVDAAVVQNDGAPVCRVTLSDITERKQAESEQKNLQIQLVQSQKMEAVGRLAGGVAHDFNNMLGVILGHTDIILEELDPALPIHANLEAIKNAAQRSAGLTRQLLTFARKQTVMPKVLDLNLAMEEMLQMIHRLIGEDIDLIWLPGKDLKSVKIDPTQIDQILVNLCVNARDAIADVGRVTIETGVAVFDEDYCSEHAGFVPGEFVRLSVSDDGCGIDQENLGQIFEPFFTTKELGKGTGLGLPMIYGIVKQNNGFINVYSELGQGTTFNIYLPRDIGEVEQIREKDPAEPVIIRGHETILLVEDEPALMELTKMMLEKVDHMVVAAGTPDEAIRIADEYAGQIQLLITDVVMPEMNGRDLAKKLLSSYPDLKCLFMSGYTADIISHHGLLDEGVYFIQKPFSMKELGIKVNEALEKK